jgi:hypothetical protein
MNLTYQKNYIKQFLPEVIDALNQEYSEDKPFINTKYVIHRLKYNPDLYPLLSSKTYKHIAEIVTTCLRDKLHYKIFTTARGGRNKGRIFVRKVKKP